MIDIESGIQGVRKLINVPSVLSLVSEISAGNMAQQKYNSLSNAKSKFIIINSLPVPFGALQSSIVNVSMYAPNTSAGTADILALKQILLAVKPLLENGEGDQLYTVIDDESRVSLLEEPSINYHYYNLRVQVFGFNL